jgi:hypothetical protein
MRPFLLAAALGCAPVALEEPAVECPDGTCLEGELGTWTIGPVQERDGLCFSWTLGNEETLYINALTATNDGYFHHSNWFWVPEDEWALPDGPWDCGDNDFSELQAAALGGVLFAQSTQLAEETQEFLPGYAIRVPPRSRIIANAHLLNLTEETQTTSLRTQLQLLKPDEVVASLAPWRFNYGDLDIPAQQTSEHSGSCEIRAWYEMVNGSAFDVRLHYILPHFHSLGQGFDAVFLGGPQDGESILSVRDAWGHPFGHTFAEPIDLSAADGVRFSCEHRNNTDADVGYGIGDQEMCVALAFVESELMIDTSVLQTSETGVSGEIQTRSGDCIVFGAPFEP